MDRSRPLSHAVHEDRVAASSVPLGDSMILFSGPEAHRQPPTAATSQGMRRNGAAKTVQRPTAVRVNALLNNPVNETSATYAK